MDATDAQLHIAADVVPIVTPAVLILDRLEVVESEPALNEPLAHAASVARRTVESAEITAAVRTMYKRTGIDPTKTRPSSEALLRRVRKGGELPRINNLVDVINWCSLESQLPFGLYDCDRVRGKVTLRLGLPGEQYEGIRKEAVRVEHRLVLADDDGPFGNPTSDSARTMITTGSTRALVVVFAPPSVPQATTARLIGLVGERTGRYCSAGRRPTS